MSEGCYRYEERGKGMYPLIYETGQESGSLMTQVIGPSSLNRELV